MQTPSLIFFGSRSIAAIVSSDAWCMNELREEPTGLVYDRSLFLDSVYEKEMLRALRESIDVIVQDLGTIPDDISIEAMTKTNWLTKLSKDLDRVNCLNTRVSKEVAERSFPIPRFPVEKTKTWINDMHRMLADQVMSRPTGTDQTGKRLMFHSANQLRELWSCATLKLPSDNSKPPHCYYVNLHSRTHDAKTLQCGKCSLWFCTSHWEEETQNNYPPEWPHGIMACKVCRVVDDVHHFTKCPVCKFFWWSCMMCNRKMCVKCNGEDDKTFVKHEKCICKTCFNKL